LRLSDIEVFRPFEAQVAVFRAKNGEILTNRDQVLSRWKKHLNEEEECEKPPDQVDFRDDGVEIYLPNREEIESVAKNIKNNEAPDSDSNAA
jgi:hypothetical protein